jgi:MFS family permease
VGAIASDTDAAVPLSPTIVMVWLSAAVLGCCACMSVPLMHLVPLIQGKGISPPEASSVLFLLLVVAILGRVAFGRLADIIGAIPAYMTASLWQTALVYLFTQVNDLNMLYVFAAIYGFGYAGVMTGVLVTIRALTPASRRGISTGVIIAFAWLGHGIGGYQGGLFFDLTGTYNVGFANAALAGVINLLVVGSLYLTVRRKTASSVSATA